MICYIHDCLNLGFPECFGVPPDFRVSGVDKKTADECVECGVRMKSRMLTGDGEWVNDQPRSP